MKREPDRFTKREMAVIRKIIADETWLEGERRSCEVQPDDPVVLENVAAVIMRIGQQMREEAGQEG